MSEILETLETNRRRMLVGLTASFAAWQLGHIAQLHFSTLLSKSATFGFGMLTIAGSLSWVFCCYLLMKYHRMLKQNPQYCGNLDDERNRSIRHQAFTVGFVACLATAAIGLAISSILAAFNISDLTFYSAGLASHSVLFVGIISSLTAYLILDK